MWIIAGTIPDPDFSLLVPEGPAPRSASLSEAGLHLPDGRTVPVERGTAALAATALQTCAALGCTPPALLLAGDTGSGSGSRQLFMAGEGDNDAAVFVVGLIVGAACAHNFGMASSTAGIGPNGMLGALGGLAVCLLIGFFNCKRGA